MSPATVTSIVAVGNALSGSMVFMVHGDSVYMMGEGEVDVSVSESSSLRTGSKTAKTTTVNNTVMTTNKIIIVTSHDHLQRFEC